MAEPLDSLIKGYAIAYRAIQAEQAQIAANPKAFRRRARLTEMQDKILTLLDDLDTQAKDVVRRELPEVYGSGARQAARVIGTPGPTSFTQTDVKAVKLLANDLFDDLLEKTEYIRGDTKRLIRNVVRDRVLTGSIAGDSPAKIRKQVREYLEKNGVGRIRYSDGRRVRLDDYADMAIRTKRSIAANIGSINYSKANGVSYMECLDGPGCSLYSHSVGPLANGLVLTTDEALKYPIAHPNCRRIWSARPNVSTAEEAKNAKPTVTREQIADQIAADQARRAQQAKRLANRRRREKIADARERTQSARETKIRG